MMASSRWVLCILRACLVVSLGVSACSTGESDVRGPEGESTHPSGTDSTLLPTSSAGTATTVSVTSRASDHTSAASSVGSSSTASTTASSSNHPASNSSASTSSEPALTTSSSQATEPSSNGQGSSAQPTSAELTSAEPTSAPVGFAGCAAADILCADFEDVSVGALPSGGKWLAAPSHCANTGYEIGVEASSGSNGSQALVSSNSSSSTNACALVADMGEQSEFWLRAMVKYVGTGPTNEHEITFFELGEHAEQDDPEARVGFRNDGCHDTDGSPFGGLEFNMTKGPGGEFTGCTGVPLDGDRWYCVEIHVVLAGAQTKGELYLDGEEQAFTNHGSAVDEVLAEGSFRYLKLGAQTYGSVNTGPLVLDDVAVGTKRQGCP